jgi:hypothetical protein
VFISECLYDDENVVCKDVPILLISLNSNKHTEFTFRRYFTSIFWIFNSELYLFILSTRCFNYDVIFVWSNKDVIIHRKEQTI